LKIDAVGVGVSGKRVYKEIKNQNSVDSRKNSEEGILSVKLEGKKVW